MELKSAKAMPGAGEGMGFNRTFMELKLEMFAKPKSHTSVLIVPLWN